VPAVANIPVSSNAVAETFAIVTVPMLGETSTVSPGAKFAPDTVIVWSDAPDVNEAVDRPEIVGAGNRTVKALAFDALPLTLTVTVYEPAAANVRTME